MLDAFDEDGEVLDKIEEILANDGVASRFYPRDSDNCFFQLNAAGSPSFAALHPRLLATSRSDLKSPNSDSRASFARVRRF